ncbi:D-inositol-3-phosphate glycosyltransferase [Fundidesulfovibrio magnetotacticus]|uniref:D-inositol-3-phosphate glycosyltransferase n=1 Tax=Fundidesulfovibrio magnetotacticus TaxID=2730080 RepID=A0A6V8LU03_9BACT|nr:glycosyltransferase [Fundidesulfovibrio magnetotacticus]GFK95204.1 D-inositol-3-phosphate glycosyltransferase [Fundidesulfovibrio magnetotacticus]
MRQSPIILHDAFRFPGGGEKVAQCLAELTGGILWTAEYNHAAFPPDFFGERHPLDLRARQAHPDLARWSETACLWKAFASFPPSNPPYTLYSGMLAPLAWKRLGGKRILYCHTPPRILYDQRRFYLRSMPRAKRWAYELFLRAFEHAWAKAARAMDLIVSNSQNVAHRLGGYLQLDSVVVPPPVRTADFRWIAQEDFYLSTARVDRLKRVDTVVEAFLGMPEKRLVVVSGGSELERVRAMAVGAPNIEVKGWVTPEELRALTGACIATVYIPRDEDFGISPVESMAAGKPVIGVAEGGLLETVRENRTGILVRQNPTASDVALAVRAMSPEAALAMRPACEERARKFDEAAFKAAMAGHIASVTGQG